LFEVSTTSFHTNVDERRLVAERAKFAKHVMVSAGVCFGGKGRLHFIPDKTKVNAKLYLETLLPKLVPDCRFVLPSGFTFQQGSIMSLLDALHTWQSCRLKTGLLPTAVNSLVKITGLRTRLTSTLWTTMSGPWGAMLERYKSFQPKPKNINQLKKVLEFIWDQLPQDSINKYGIEYLYSHNFGEN